jgi:hypothetical protein
MILREFVKRLLNLREADIGLEDKVAKLNELAHSKESQLEINEAEIIHLKSKLSKIRKLIGRDDECFSRFTRKQIDDMSIGEFVKLESKIDQDVDDGKIFLQ